MVSFIFTLVLRCGQCYDALIEIFPDFISYNISTCTILCCNTQISEPDMATTDLGIF